jgi:ribose-phosphate pyrophosphokinase
MLGGEICIIDKRRKSGTEAVAQHLIGEVTGKNVIMVDDMISTGGTMTDAVRMLKDHGVGEVYMAATHAVFSPPAMERFAKCPFTKMAVTDTIPMGDRGAPIRDRLVVLSVADLLGEAIKRIHEDSSVSELFKDGGFYGRALSE